MERKKIKLIFIQPKSAFVSEAIPLGFGYISAIAKKHGAEVRIIDASAPYASYTEESIYEICKEFRPDAIGIVFMTSHIYQAYNLVKKLKHLKIPIIGGGYHASKFPEEVLERGVDIALRGETDITITELIDYFQGLKSLEGIKGISYKKSGEIVNNPLQEKVKDLDSIPLPDREAFILADFARSEKEIKNVMSTIITSRGCPFECSFCASQSSGYRFRSAANVIQEIQQVKKLYGTRNFYLIDDTINVHRARLLELCKELKKENIVWRCNGRFDLMDEELLRAMKDAGCIHISLGVESGDEYVLNRMKKRLTPAIIREKAKLVHKVGIGQTVNFMFGFPFEKPEHIRNTVKLIKQIEPYVSDFQRAGLLIPFPGTTLYEEFKDQYNYDRWWLQPQNFMTEVRESDYRPLFKKFLFDDIGLLNKNGRFFDYSDEVVKEIRIGMRTIDQIVMKRKAKTLNFTPIKIMSSVIHLGMNAFVFSSKLLYNLNPKIERRIIHPLYYALRRNRFYLKNRQY